ncbi:MAG: CIA30 family protein [Treponema sp.]|nr:CIA30 family protein [Treponema sp.]
MKKIQNLVLIVLCCFVALALVSCGGKKDPVLATGDWMTYTDVNDGGDSTSEMEISEETIGGELKTVYTVWGDVTEQFIYGFAGWGLDADDETNELYKTASMLSFTILGDGNRYSIKFKISSVKDHAYHQFTFDTEEDEAITIEVPMEFFMQPSWGAHARFDQELVTGVEWQTHESWRPGPFRIKMWDFMIHP